MTITIEQLNTIGKQAAAMAASRTGMTEISFDAVYNAQNEQFGASGIVDRNGEEDVYLIDHAQIVALLSMSESQVQDRLIAILTAKSRAIFGG